MEPLVLKIKAPNMVQMVASAKAKPAIAAAFEAAWMQQFDDRYEHIMQALRADAKQDGYSVYGELAETVKQRFRGTFEFHRTQLEELSKALMADQVIKVEHVYTFPAARTAVALVKTLSR
jgi:hypothetical protein